MTGALYEREQQLILMTTDVAEDTKSKVRALGTIVKEVTPLVVKAGREDKSYHNQPSKYWLWSFTEYDRIVRLPSLPSIR